MRTVVAISGMCPTIPDKPSTITASTTEWVSAARRERAPERTLTAVRAIAPVAATQPKSGTTRLAMPWPSSSRSGS